MMETASKSVSAAPTCIDFEEYLKSDGDRIIHAVIHRYGAGLDWEEAYQEMSVALWRALQAYDPSRPAKVSTLVYRAVLNRLRMLQRKNHSMKGYFDRYARADESECEALKDESINFEEETEQAEILESRASALYWAIQNAGLKDEERLVILETLKGTQQVDIGAIIGRGQSQISRFKLSAMQKIRDALLAANWDGEGIWAPDFNSGKL